MNTDPMGKSPHLPNLYKKVRILFLNMTSKVRCLKYIDWIESICINYSMKNDITAEILASLRHKFFWKMAPLVISYLVCQPILKSIVSNNVVFTYSSIEQARFISVRFQHEDQFEKKVVTHSLWLQFLEHNYARFLPSNIIQKVMDRHFFIFDINSDKTPL